MFPKYLLLVFTIFAANTIYIGLAVPCCPPNQEYVNGTANCPPTCEIRHPPCHIVNIKMNSGCQCKEGYIFLDDRNKTCVPIDKCPGTCSKPHFEYNQCGTRCPLTCQNQEPRGCVKICEPGCFCVEHFILDEYTLTCVCNDKCPK